MLLDEWKDDNFSKNLTTLIALIMLTGSIFLSITTNLEKELFYYLGVSSLIILIAVQLEGKFLHSNFFGSKEKLYYGLIGGLLIGLFLGYLSRGGVLNVVLPTQALYLGDFNFLFGNIVAPMIEPLFWRGVVFTTAYAITLGAVGKKNKALAIVIALAVSSYGFGFFHLSAFYSQAGSLAPTYEAIIFATLFGMVFTITNSIVKSIGLEVGWHFVNNLFSQGYAFGDILLTIVVAGIAAVIVIEIVDRRSRG